MVKPYFINLELHEDDRGSVHCILDNIANYGIKRIYLVENLARGQVRAWHGHTRGDTFIYCVSGNVKCAGLSMDDVDSVVSGVLTSRKPRIFFVPRGWYNGAMSLTDNTKLLVFSTLSFDEVKEDDARLAWDVTPGVWEVKNR